MHFSFYYTLKYSKIGPGAEFGWFSGIVCYSISHFKLVFLLQNEKILCISHFIWFNFLKIFIWGPIWARCPGLGRKPGPAENGQFYIFIDNSTVNIVAKNRYFPPPPKIYHLYFFPVFMANLWSFVDIPYYRKLTIINTNQGFP